MNGLDHRGYPRRSLWACFYAAALILGLLYVTDREQALSLASATDGLAAYRHPFALTPDGGAMPHRASTPPRETSWTG